MFISPSLCLVIPFPLVFVLVSPSPCVCFSLLAFLSREYPSPQGSPQSILVDLAGPVSLSGVAFVFQGGFAGKDVSIFARKADETFSLVTRARCADSGEVQVTSTAPSLTLPLPFTPFLCLSLLISPSCNVW